MNRIFFGWWVLAGLFLIYTASNGIVIFTLPLISPALMEEFGWNQAQVTRPATIFYFATGLMSPISGYFLDRLSAKIIMLLGVVAVTVALGFHPFITTLVELMAIYLVFSAGLATGGLLPSMVLLTRWFARYRGIAIGILLLSGTLGGAIFSLMVRNTLAAYGWREAIIMLTVVGGAMMILSVLFLVRNHPRDMGLNPDGAESPPEPAKIAPEAPSAGGGPTLLDAIKSPISYFLIFTTGTVWFCVVGVIVHQPIYLNQDLSVDISMVALIVSVYFWFSVMGYLLFGYLADHFNKSHIMLLAVINLALGLILLRIVEADDRVTVFAYAAIFGMGFSGAFSMVQLTIAEHFAGNDYGRILGVFVFIDTMAGGLGIFVLGEMRVALGSYIPAFNLMIALCVIAAICVIIINQQSKHRVRVTA
jgi:sugar phosphate permease